MNSKTLHRTHVMVVTSLCFYSLSLFIQDQPRNKQTSKQKKTGFKELVQGASVVWLIAFPVCIQMEKKKRH